MHVRFILFKILISDMYGLDRFHFICGKVNTNVANLFQLNIRSNKMNRFQFITL